MPSLNEYDFDNMEIVEGSARQATDEEAFLLKSMSEMPKSNLDTYNQVLRLLLGIIVTFLGGSIVFLDKQRLPGWSLWPAMVMLLLAFVASLFGVIPVSSNAPHNLPNEIKKSFMAALSFKQKMLWATMGLLSLSLFFSIIGLCFSSLLAVAQKP